MAQFKRVRVPQLAWYGNTELELQFPLAWEVVTLNMKGWDRPPLTEEELKEAFAGPIGSQRIGELARGKKDVAILFDDMSRPTRVAELVPYILDELAQAGVPDDGIRFIAAVGAHGALTRIDFAKKLGEAVLERFPVYNHNPYENCTPLGETSRGTPVAVNSEVMSCDLKIGIGCIVPHPITGFGGGGKIILPGVASIDTIVANHGALMQRAFAAGERPGIGLGTFEENLVWQDVVEATRLAGLDIKIDALVNTKGETTALFVGDPVAEQTEGVKLAREVYATPRPAGVEIAVVNAYSKASEANLTVPLGTQALGEEGGDLVVIANAPEGQVTHYVYRSFGKEVGGRLWRRRSSLSPKVKRLIIYAPYMDRTAADWIAPPESIIWAKTWVEVLEVLREAHRGSARVAVVPDATIQYFV